MKRAVLAVLFLLAACGETVSVPREACHDALTGRTSEYTYMQCYPVGDSACGMVMPITQTTTEVVTTCKYSYWK